jgi:hypothetical protein
MMGDFEAAEIPAAEARIFVRRTVAEAPVLLLHGFPQTYLMWRRVVPRLARGWIEVRGEPVQGTANAEWITPSYLAGVPGTGEPTSAPLAWCPPKGSAAPHPSGRLRLATWNLENLHAQDGQSTYLGPDPSVKRMAVEYERMRC